jgi:predicted Zn-dependent protease
VVNSAYYPEESLKGAVEVFKKYTDANATISQVFDINIPEDHNGAISLKQVARIQFSIVSNKFIPVLFVPSINDFDNRGFCQTFANPDNQLINQRIVINECRVESRAKKLLMQRQFVYKMVILHEMCHALGVPADPNHSDGSHCTNPNCILYEGIDVKSVSYAIFHFGPPKGLCKDCLHEIALARRNSSTPDSGK